MVVLTSALFAYLSRLGLGFGKTALTLALGYNVVIALIKIILSPYGLYLSTNVAEASTLLPLTPTHYLLCRYSSSSTTALCSSLQAYVPAFR